MLEKTFACFKWSYEACEKIAKDLLKRQQILLTAPLEIVERFAEQVHASGLFGYKVTIKPVAGNPNKAHARTLSGGPCCVSKLSGKFKEQHSCPPCDGPIHSLVGVSCGQKCRYWYCKTHMEWLDGLKSKAKEL
jgi:hypothetical protein